MTVIANAGLVLKDSQGNKGIVKSFTDNDIDKISSAIIDVGQVVDPATHMPIEATTASVGVVQLATAQDIKDGTAGKVVDAKELADAIGDIKLADSAKFSVVAGANIDATGIPTVAYNNGTFTFNYLKGAKGDQGPQGPQGPKGPKGDTADSIAWTNVSGKPSTYTPSSHDHIRYGLSFDNICADTNTGWYESRYKAVGDDNNTHLYINDYFGIHFHTLGSFDVNGKAILHEGNIDTKLYGKADSSLSNISNTAKAVIAHNSMPSNSYVALSIGASGTTYTAPADGWFFATGRGTSTDGFVTLTNSASDFFIQTTTSHQGYTMPCFIPIRKGDIAQLQYSSDVTIVIFKFIYAEGAK